MCVCFWPTNTQSDNTHPASEHNHTLNLAQTINKPISFCPCLQEENLGSLKVTVHGRLITAHTHCGFRKYSSIDSFFKR